MATESGARRNLPMLALKEIPQPRADAQRITALVKERGRIAGYQLSDGRVLTKAEGVRLAREGGIHGVGISSRKGNEYLKSIPDGQENNNLSNLPSVPNTSKGTGDSISGHLKGENTVSAQKSEKRNSKEKNISPKTNKKKPEQNQGFQMDAPLG